tara:strand:- start:543 stop:749 length:207 start_codon:yes stop_codon:yes gene_type:complete
MKFKAGELVEVGYKIDPFDDWNDFKGLAIVLEHKTELEFLKVEYVKERAEGKLSRVAYRSRSVCRRVA